LLAEDGLVDLCQKRRCYPKFAKLSLGLLSKNGLFLSNGFQRSIQLRLESLGPELVFLLLIVPHDPGDGIIGE